MSDTTLTVGDALRIDVEGCPPWVLNDHRFSRRAHVGNLIVNNLGEGWVIIAWPDGWQLGVSLDVALRMREAYLAERAG